MTNGEPIAFFEFVERYLNTHHYFRIDKARRDLHWRPRTALEQGIQQTAAAVTR